MVLEIVLSKDKKQATIHFDTGKSVTLYHSEGLVADLVSELLYGHETYNQYINSFEDTIDLTNLIEAV